MRRGYSPVTHRTVVGHPARRSSGVHDSGVDHPLTIPRRDVRRTRPRRADRCDRAGSAPNLTQTGYWRAQVTRGFAMPLFARARAEASPTRTVAGDRRHDRPPAPDTTPVRSMPLGPTRCDRSGRIDPARARRSGPVRPTRSGLSEISRSDSRDHPCVILGAASTTGCRPRPLARSAPTKSDR
jgi:hypothetical protein